MSEISKEELAEISRFARKDISEEEIYTFSVILCDNEIDRDGEKFSVETLKELSELFVGKTGIFDHDMKSKNQTGRIYSCEVITDDGKRTADGEVYTCIRAKAYMVKNEKNQPLIDEIETGIKKETSVNCAVKSIKCSICGEDARKVNCRHIKGEKYGDKICFHILEGATDAYEWSFVAVPAQKNAGVIKAYTYCGGIDKDDIEEYRKQLSEAIFLGAAKVLPSMKKENLEVICSSLKLKQLKDMKDAIQQAADRDLPLIRQLEISEKDKETKTDFTDYKI